MLLANNQNGTYTCEVFFARIANITCGSSRAKDNFFLLNECVVQVKNHLRSCNLSGTKVTEYDLILARAGKFHQGAVLQKNVCISFASH